MQILKIWQLAIQAKDNLQKVILYCLYVKLLTSQMFGDMLKMPLVVF